MLNCYFGIFEPILFYLIVVVSILLCGLKLTNSFLNSVLLSFYSYWHNSFHWHNVNSSLQTNFSNSAISLSYLVKSYKLNFLNQFVCLFCLSAFFVLLFCNLSGLIPFSEALTSNVGFTLALSFSLWFTCVIIAFAFYRHAIVNLFLPSGTPWIMLPFFLALEIVSFSFRAISLGVRLWANMTAGHSLLQILTGMCLGLLNGVNIFLTFPVGLILSSLLSALVGLEWLICLLQSVVFVMLSSFYLAEVWYPVLKLWSKIN